MKRFLIPPPPENASLTRISKGFTLAEVLITLTVLGIIAALTVPSIIHNFRKIRVETTLKIVYSTLANALSQAEAEYGMSSEQIYADVQTNNTKALPAKIKRSYFLNTYMKPFLNGTVTDYSAPIGDTMILTLKNGVQIYTRDWPAFNIVVIEVDLNGTKGPNKSGIDKFVLEYNKTAGFQGFDKGRGWHKLCELNSDGSYDNAEYQNYNCADRIIKNGFKIPENYPYKF